MTNYQRTYSIGEVEVEGSAIYHTTEYRERRDHYTLFGCTREIDGFDTSRDAFVGVHNGLHEAAVPFAGAAHGSVAHGWNPIGSHQLDLRLAPGEEETFAFVLALRRAGRRAEVRAPRRREQGAGTRAARTVQRAGRGRRGVRVGAHAVGRPALRGSRPSAPTRTRSRMLNTWNQYQCMATFNLSRSASLYETGIGRGMGFRDSNQDVLGFVHLIPDRARQRILDLAATQLSDGTCFHQYQPLTKKGNAEIGGDFYDDHLWLVLSTCAYVKETGDASILDEPVGYADTPGSGESLLHHLETSVAYTLGHRGPHGLPLIGHADWNDCLNLNCFSTEPDESFQTAGDVEGSQRRVGDDRGSLPLRLPRARRALPPPRPRRPTPTGSTRTTQRCSPRSRSTRGTATGTCARTTPPASRSARTRATRARSSSRARAGACSAAPAATTGARAARSRASTSASSPSTASSSSSRRTATTTSSSARSRATRRATRRTPASSATTTRGSNSAWCLLGEGDRAFEYYLSTCPSAQEERIETYRSEPYVYAQMIAGPDAATPGEAKNSWLTGTAAWTFVTISQGILGIKPDYDGLRIDPCIPSSWRSYHVRRRFRDVVYDISVENPDGVCSGIRSLRVDGKEVDGNLVPVAPGAERVEVEVVLGSVGAEQHVHGDAVAAFR